MLRFLEDRKHQASLSPAGLQYGPCLSRYCDPGLRWVFKVDVGAVLMLNLEMIDLRRAGVVSKRFNHLSSSEAPLDADYCT